MRYLLAIPVYNEAPNLQAILHEARSYARDILVVDDGSDDATPRLLKTEKDVFQLRHDRNYGYGQSLKDAFEFAIQRGYDWLITMDCDEQHEPVRIPEFLQAARENDADIISGSRYLQTMSDNTKAPMDRRLINRKITNLLNHLLDMELTDAFCGFKAYRVSALQQLNITVPGYAMPMQFWVQAVRSRMRIRELAVPLIYNDLTRCFGGALDDPNARFNYYYQVLMTELAREPFLNGAAKKSAQLRTNCCNTTTLQC
jgi:dolichol-phosphate mannosyltransferase